MRNDEKIDTTKAVVSWLTGQSFNNILLVAILGVFVWGGRFIVTDALPNGMKQIQDGYKEIEESHSKDRALIIQQYDKWFDLIERRQKGDPMGHYVPDPGRIKELWRSTDETNYRQLDPVVGSTGIAYSIPAPAIEVTTPGGTTVSWGQSRDSGSRVSWGTDGGRQSRGAGRPGSGWTDSGGAKFGDLQGWRNGRAGVF